MNRDPVYTPFSYPQTPDVETLSIFHLDPSDYGHACHRCTGHFSFYGIARAGDPRDKSEPQDTIGRPMSLAGLSYYPHVYG